MPALTSAAGLVGFLSEPDPTLQAFALERLNEEIDSVWTEVSGSIGQMYVLNALLDIPKSRHAPWSCALAARLTS
jgi:hypothetical protein